MLGDSSYGVYGNSSSGFAGFFQGNAKVTGNLTVEGSLSISSFNADTLDGLDSTDLSLSTHNHDAAYVNEGQADSITSSMITDGTILESDLAFALGSGTGHSLNAADGSPTDVVYVDNTGNVGVGTTTPEGKLDVSGDICLGSVCRTTWPAGTGTGAFTDTGTAAYYSGGNVGIGTSTPTVLGSAEGRGLHIMKTISSSNDIAAGIRLEIDSVVNGGITATYNDTTKEGGIFVGTLSSHRLGFGTNGTEKMTIMPNGNVGIGVFDPVQPLHVQGNAYIYNNLGIGVASPSNNLQVSGSDALFSSDIADFRLSISKKLETDHASVIFQNNFTAHAEVGLTGDNNFHIKISPDGTTLTDALFIDSTTSMVGIGTNLPEMGKLNVISKDASMALYAENEGEGGMAIFARKEGTGHAVRIRKGGDGYGLFISQLGSDPALVINNVSAESLLVVESTGNVGIGTASPTSRLDINGLTGTDQLRIRTSYTPTGTGDANGNIGDVTWDDNFMYIKTSAGWKRSALSIF